MALDTDSLCTLDFMVQSGHLLRVVCPLPSVLLLDGLQSRLLDHQLGNNLHVAFWRRGQGLGHVDVTAVQFVSLGLSEWSAP